MIVTSLVHAYNFIKHDTTGSSPYYLMLVAIPEIQWIRGTVLELRNRVLLCNVGLQGIHKIVDKWSQEVYVVVKKPNSYIPVYELKPETVRADVLHYKLFLPIPYLPLKSQTMPQLKLL